MSMLMHFSPRRRLVGAFGPFGQMLVPLVIGKCRGSYDRPLRCRFSLALPPPTWYDQSWHSAHRSRLLLCGLLDRWSYGESHETILLDRIESVTERTLWLQSCGEIIDWFV